MTDQGAYTNFGRVGLVSAPWPLYNRPSIQLGALTAWLNRQLPDLAVDPHHFYLDAARAVGLAAYDAVSRRSWAGEAVFAALLYPERKPRAEAVFQREMGRSQALSTMGFDGVLARMEAAVDQFLAGLDPAAWGLAGFSVCLGQLTASLYLIKRIKALRPDLPVALGGSQVCGRTGADLAGAFPEIDWVVNGEGEGPLAALVQDLAAGRRPPRGLLPADGFDQRMDLNDLPLPDYDDYFKRLKSFPPDRSFFPALPVEASRGCWWSAAGERTGRGGCAFCNLNRQWQGYRGQTPEIAAARVEALTARYRLLAVNFMDNLLPPQTGELFSRLAASGRDYDLFGECRAAVDQETLAAMRRAGVRDLQIGVEALSDSLLKKINKGASTLDNLRVMRDCEELGLHHGGNLMLHFPTSDEADVAETLEAIAAARAFRPLSPVRFWLGLSSPVHDRAGEFGLTAVYNHRYYRAFFPAAVRSRVRFMVQEYRGDLTWQRRLWRPVARALADWREEYDALNARPGARPILSYRDGGDFLILRRRRGRDRVETHRLTGKSRRIYLFCRKPRTIPDVTGRFGGLGAEAVEGFLRSLTAKGLMFDRGGRWLSLAVRWR